MVHLTHTMPRSATILGAGLVGSLLAVVLRKRGHSVAVYERRPDMRKASLAAGRSINLALSARGWKALELAGLKDDMAELAIPMNGRYLHQADGSTAFQPYGKNNEAIYSVSRGELNKRLMTRAEQEGATIHFEQRCNRVDVTTNKLYLESGEVLDADLLFGADGAFSALRSSYVQMERVNASQQYLEHGYKELTIPPAADGSFRMEKHALHIWPRSNFMLIALPNTDGSFTCTLFMPFKGEKASFEVLKTEQDVQDFFKAQFPDAVAMMPELEKEFFANPTSSLITTHIFPWHHQDKSALIGDAAHAIVPFYGQGMNAGFEDVSILSGLLDAHSDDWTTILTEYERFRKPNGDAVAQLALMNFVEMRDKVSDPRFLERKKVEKELGRRYPDQFISVYEMVSFSHTPYDTALQCIQAQDRLLERILNTGNFFENIETNEFCTQLDSWMGEYHRSIQPD